MDYAEPLLQLILNELKSENVDNVLEIFNNYNLNPDFLKEHLVDLQFNPTKVDLFKSVETKTKTNLTRKYNLHHKGTFKDTVKAHDNDNT